MISFGLNHMTVPRVPARDLLGMASALGCTGVEFRNDLNGPLFDGEDPKDIGAAAREAGLRILALAEVKAFNDAPSDKLPPALDLMQMAAACGAEGVALIPQLATGPSGRDRQRLALRAALEVLQAPLEDHGLTGLIEPLGFAHSTLRLKRDVVAVLDDMNRPACFGIVHDTFHHHLAGEDTFQAQATALVHISGITDLAPTSEQMIDAHRVLVDADDRLGNLPQLRALQMAGYEGPVSFEAFAPEIHNMTQPAEALARSQEFITSHLARRAA
ncbi:TIM barrel protein [Ruegeria sp. 2205SS24-7]|uniref:TIM barrel protein n=1 Tax=Ruegeria discodermiae TaxID=3064389 RepID=UPI0027405B61|nr:TIM barrel protein [Ruegeria sp. 2205SS24-7]MDP5220002.1 TIM barrel protein [Ruegeria sp. 2205SS24-7]